MHGNMRRVGHQRPTGIKQRAGEVQPLADVHGATGLAQAFAHALRDLHEAVMKEAQIHRIRASVHLSGRDHRVVAAG